ncbi:uncharacterized protein AMSG_08996 [Thecamonas trahens ATCC 50062]|uniref:Fungal lipase-type domain-containing protein n=1 Tax=Thecamonas trahens ATCC 50062 TaxID=461836 RepID=A0A0L0DKB5_THETB|nr:hypothetical protein AMSG_08996 [Thecamonas trahens ATCC 50062]KNC52849.1 hypothetical protein AMSG_08996 [Thecamonas trahens ATCC 50062]|eukprot:XP_013754952.1 hypothetical protein AMSG_08996 [Thecamonas trahens ATCC 50062]
MAASNSNSVSLSSSSCDAPVVHKKENRSNMRIIASTIKELAGDVGSWGIGDLTLGLHYLKKAKKREAATRELDLSRKHDPDEWLEEMREWLDIIEGTYKGSTEAMCELTGIPAEDVLKTDWKSTTLKPGYYVALLRKKKQVVFAIRGTANMKDALTDLTAAQNDWPLADGERVHRGMHISTMWFMENVKPLLEEALEANPGYELTVVGHSLGGATAALSTLLLREAGLPAKGIVIAPAACLSLGAATAAADHVTTFVLADDCVPRFSLSAVEELRLEISNYPWGDEAMDSIRQTRLVRACADNPVGQAIGSGMSSAYRGASQGARAVSRGFSKMGSKMSSMWNKSTGNDSSDDGSDNGENAKLKVSDLSDEEKEKIVPLYPPGNVFKVERDRDGSYHLVESDNELYGKLELSDFMFSDHSSTNYIDSLDRILGRKPMIDTKSDAGGDDSSSDD